MTIFYPVEIPPTSPRSEIKVRERLAGIDDLVVFHSVAWQSRRSGRQGDGEADFVVLVPDLGILILEVKGGGIEVVDGTWYSTGSDGIRHSIKDPFNQAKDSKYALLAFFKTVDPSLARYPIVHGVVFPDIVVNEMLGFNAPRAITIDRIDLAQPRAIIKKIFHHWGQGQAVAKDDAQRIIGHLAPTIRVRRLLRDDVGDAEQALIDLTAEQMGVLQAIRRNKRAAILGGAGTGKTVLAAEKARQLASSGFRTLLLCYNAPLRWYLASILNDSSVEVETFHSLTLREAKRARLKVPFDPKSEWYESDAPRILRDAATHNGTRYEAILVDEAQDFSMEWISVTQSLVTDDDLLYLFADSHQNLYRRGWSIPKGIVEFDLTLNCRNTRQIARRVANVFGDRLDGKLVDGPEPRFIEADRREQLIPYVIGLVESIISEHEIEPTQMIVLTDSAALTSELRSTGVAGHLFTTLEGHGVPVETVYRFKGLEREVVILVLSDAMTKDDLRAIAYVGLSRAKVGLYVVASRKIRETIAWAP